MSEPLPRTSDALEADSRAASKRGRRSRQKGHEAERRLCGWLRENGWPHAHTSRAALGHDGTRQPGDVAGGPEGWLIDVKDVAGSSFPAWCRKAAEDADGGLWCVVKRVRGCPDVADWVCKYSSPQVRGTVLHATFGAWVRLLERDSEGRV